MSKQNIGAAGAIAPAHTEEPWIDIVLDGRISIQNPDAGLEDNTICGIFYEPNTLPLAKANASRIIACVNAMAGIEDPETWVKSSGDAVAEMSNMLVKVKQHLINIDLYFKSPRMVGEIDFVLNKYIP